MAEFKLGWIEPEKRNLYQQASHISAMAKLPKFAAPPVAGGKPPVGTKLLLTDLWKHQKVVDLFGEPFSGTHQQTGSCVGVGGGNVIFTTVLADILRRSENEKVVFPWFWYNYGMSRFYMGERTAGEGSLGSTFAKSWNEDGSSDSAIESLQTPKPLSTKDGWDWGEKTELVWSNGAVRRPEMAAESNMHKGTSTPSTSGDATRDFVLNGYGCTRAAGTFCNPNTAQVKGDVLIGTENGRGGHQMAYLGYWNHPTYGELLYNMNQWGKKAYGIDPGGGPAGGYWVHIDAVDRICRSEDGEVFAFSNYQGYPAQPDLYDWMTQSFYS